jgi:hypothetical protein
MTNDQLQTTNTILTTIGSLIINVHTSSSDDIGNDVNTSGS